MPIGRRGVIIIRNIIAFNEFIICYKAYPCLRFFIPPFIINPGALADGQLRFNTAYAKTRIVEERSFAL